MMDSPLVQSIMSNPELMRSMLMADPNVRALCLFALRFTAVSQQPTNQPTNQQKKTNKKNK